jgi:hypothetical protein
LSIGTCFSHYVFALKRHSKGDVRVCAFRFEGSKIGRRYLLELIMSFGEEMVLLFLRSDDADPASLLFRFQSFQDDFGHIVILTTNTGFLHDFLIKFKFDDSHDEVAIVLDLVAKTVVIDRTCVIPVFIEMEIHVYQLKTFRCCQVEFLHKLP